jgi:hypothetical protein
MNVAIFDAPLLGEVGHGGVAALSFKPACAGRRSFLPTNTSVREISTYASKEGK